MNEQERLQVALEQLDPKTRRLILSFVESILDATEIIPSGHGAPEGINAKGFESRVPGDLHMFAAQIVREATQAIRATNRDGVKLRTMMQKRGTGQSKYVLPKERKPGRPSVITWTIVAYVLSLRRKGYTVSQSIAKVSADCGVSESALWKAKERGGTDEGTSVEIGLAKALEAVQARLSNDIL